MATVLTDETGLDCLVAYCLLLTASLLETKTARHLAGPRTGDTWRVLLGAIQFAASLIQSISPSYLLVSCNASFILPIASWFVKSLFWPAWLGFLRLLFGLVMHPAWSRP